MDAQQPVGPRVQIPVPVVQPFLLNIGDTPPDIRHWLLSFKTYLDCVEINQDAGNPLEIFAILLWQLSLN